MPCCVMRCCGVPCLVCYLFRLYDVPHSHNTGKHRPAQLSSVQQRSAVWCRAVLSGAVLFVLWYGALPCCDALSLSSISGIIRNARYCLEILKNKHSAQRRNAVQRGAVLCSFAHIKRSMYVHACGVRVVLLHGA